MKLDRFAPAIFATSLILSGCWSDPQNNKTVTEVSESLPTNLDNLWNHFAETHQQGGYISIEVTNLGGGSIFVQRGHNDYRISLSPNLNTRTQVFNSTNGSETGVETLNRENDFYLDERSMKSLLGILSLNSAFTDYPLKEGDGAFYVLPSNYIDLNNTEIQTSITFQKSVVNGEVETSVLYNFSPAPDTL